MPGSSSPTPWWQDWGLSYLPDVYGEINGGHSVQEALYRTIEKWLPAYIREVNRNLGGEVLQIPKNYRRKPEFRPLQKGIDVAVLVAVNGTSGEPNRQQQAYRTNWDADVGVFVYGTTDWQETQALTLAYGACVRAAVIQHPSLGTDGLVSSVLWVSEDYKEGEHSSIRTAGLATVKFEITTPNAVTPWGGPPLEPYLPAGVSGEPSLDPPAPIVIVNDYDITVESLEE